MIRFRYCILSCFLAFEICLAQQQNEPPKLEIPEITIVGKKAITLPFARKGEIYDMHRYTPPPPDSSLLGTPPSISLIGGKLPRYEHQEQPWRSSIEGAIGSFGSGRIDGFLDYKLNTWGMGGAIGYATTNGHVENASLSRFNLGGSIYALVTTDNPVLSSFRSEAGLSYGRNEYGIFGLPGTSERRSNSIVDFHLNLGSLKRTKNILDVDFTTRFNTVADGGLPGDSSISAISPAILASYAVPLKALSIAAKFMYTSSSLTYQHPTQTPSVTTLDIGASWSSGTRWRFEAGGRIGSGRAMSGEGQSLFMPYGSAEVTLDSSTGASLWFRPELTFRGYATEIEQIPYLTREIDLRPERTPLAIGGSFDIRGGKLSLSFVGTYSWMSSKAIVVSQGGYIDLEYAEASVLTAGTVGTFEHGKSARLEFSGFLTSAQESGNDNQLPMIPVLRLGAREEMKFVDALSLWASLDVQSPRNADRTATVVLPTLALVNIGGHYAIAQHIVVGAEITNLFNIDYEWWKDYPAPRLGFTVTAKVNLR